MIFAYALFPSAEYDARLVDVWAAAVVFYCMQFQELPWRVAKMSDPTFKEFVHTYHSSGAPGPLSSLSPRECRPRECGARFPVG